MATVNGHHASFVDVAGLMGDGPRGESALDTRHLLGALGELADRQSAGDPVLWQLRPRVPASETDTESLAGFTPAFTPSANTPREPHLVVDRPAGVGRWDDAGRGTDAGKQPPGRDTAQRYSGSAASPAPLRDAAKRHRRKGFADIAESRGDSAVDADDESEGDDASSSAGSDDSDASDSSDGDDDAVLRAITRGRELLVSLLPSLVGFGLALLIGGALGPLLSGGGRGVRRPPPARKRRPPPPPPPEPPARRGRGAAPPPPPPPPPDDDSEDEYDD